MSLLLRNFCLCPHIRFSVLSVPYGSIVFDDAEIIFFELESWVVSDLEIDNCSLNTFCAQVPAQVDILGVFDLFGGQRAPCHDF